MAAARLTAALDLVQRRMPPSAAPSTLEGVLRLLPPEEVALAEELVERVAQPLEEAIDAETGRPFLLTAYNREGDSHRSPWSNTYHPPLPEDEEAPYYPPEALRDLEREANELWDIYLELYYGGGGGGGGGEVVGSVYLWDQGSGNGGGGEFAGCFAVKKRIKDGAWDALHVVEALPDGRGATIYKLSSSVLLSLAASEAAAGRMDVSVSGSVSRRAEATHQLATGAGALPLGQQNLAHMGSMIEGLEIQLTGDLDSLYLQRTREVVHAVRKSGGGGGGGGGGEDEAAAQQEQQPRPPAGGVRLPGMGLGMGALPGGHQESLLAAINRRKQQREAQEEEEHVVEG